jgi:hypothetical protein
VLAEIRLLIFQVAAMTSSVPDFDSLPPVEGMPPGCAWGVFDKEGRKDVFGCLNKVNPGTVLAAATEIKEGISISLKSVASICSSISSP